MPAPTPTMRPTDPTKEDWQYIEHHMRRAFNAARPKPSEGKPSPEFLTQERRVMDYLMKKAYS